MKPRELTAALTAVVGATCVVAFAVVYLFSPELPLGPSPVALRGDVPRPSFGPPEPPPGPSSLTPAIVTHDDEDESRAVAPEDRWRPDTPAVPPVAKAIAKKPKKSFPRKALLKKKAAPVVVAPRKESAPIVAVLEKVAPPVEKVSVPEKKEDVVPAPEVVALATQGSEPEAAAMSDGEPTDFRFDALAAAPIPESSPEKSVEAPALLVDGPTVEEEAPEASEPPVEKVAAAPLTNPVVAEIAALSEAPAAEIEAAAPVLEAAAPAVEAPAPVAEAPAPALEAPAPVAEAPAPVVEAPAPVVEAPAPVVEAGAPAEPIVVTLPIVEAPTPPAEKVSSGAEPELVGGADVADAIATNALDLPSEDEGAVNALTADQIEADRWLTETDGAPAYPTELAAGTLWTENGAPGNAAETLATLEAASKIPDDFPEEIDTVPMVSVLQPTDFTPLREHLRELTVQVDQLPEVKPFRFVPPKEEEEEKAPAKEPMLVAANTPPEPELVTPKAAVAAEPEAVAKTAEELEAEWAKEKPEPELVRPKVKVREALAETTALRSTKEEAADLDAAVRRQVADDTVALGAIAEGPKTLLASAAPSAKRAAMATQPIGRVLDARQEFAAIQGTQGPVAPTVPATPVVVARRNDDRASEMRSARQTIFGQIRFGKAVEKWLEKKRGHVELYLQPENTQDPTDTIYVDYRFPEPDFQIERGGLVGRYRLIAGVFAPGSPVAVAQVPYGKLLSEENYKERVRFYLDDGVFERALSGTAAGEAKSVPLRLSLFSAGTSNYQGKGADGDGSFRQPTPIEGASVRIVGLGDVAAARSDAEGNSRFSRVPSRSDLLIEATAPGFMKSYTVVPVGDGPAYQPVYLIAKDKVETITHYFTQRPQQNGAAVVMGRVFDPQKRRPESGQTVHLQYRQGPPLYFGALPDLSLHATEKNGLFGFFNVALSASFRTIAREARDAIPFLLHLRPNTGTYVELGRGGEHALVGRLYDPFSKKPVVGSVRLVGTDTVVVETDDDGRFRLDGLEFPPGIVTLEVDAEGYPVSWVNVSWNPRDPEKTRTFFLVDDATVSQAMRDFTKVSARPDRGSLVGGAESQLFAGTQGCLNVTLESLEYGVAKPAQGPHPLLASQGGAPLCVSAKTPGFSFHDLPAGEWNLRWTDAQGQTLRTRVVRVGQGRVTVVVN